MHINIWAREGQFEKKKKEKKKDVSNRTDALARDLANFRIIY